jgi:uncharacterized coiled-coil protein SlyX
MTLSGILLDAHTSLMVAHIGHDRTDASGLGSDSVWNSNRHIYKTIATVGKDGEKATLDATAMAELGNAITGKMETLDKNFHGLRKFAQDNLSEIANKIRAIENKRPSGAGVSNSLEYKRLLEDRIGITDEIVERHNKEIANGERNVSRIDAEVANLKRKFDTFDSSSGIENFELPTRDDLQDRIQTLESYALNNGTTTGLDDKQDNTSHDIEKLGDRMDTVEAKGAEESFEMEGFVYLSYGDLLARY